MSLPIPVPPLPQAVVAVLPDTTRRVSQLVALVLDTPVPATAPDAEATKTLLVQVSQLRKKIDAERKEVGKPFLDITKQINTAAQAVLEPLDTAEAMLKDHLTKYLEAVREQERQAALAAAQAAMAAPEPGRLTPTLAILQPTAPEPAITTRTVRDVEVFDPALVPREFLVIDMVKLRAAVLAGTPVPGAKVVEKTSIVAR